MQENQAAGAVIRFAFAIMTGGASAWLIIVYRLQAGLPLVAYEPRRRVPWTWHAIALVVVAYLSALAIGVQVNQWLFSKEDEQNVATESGAFVDGAILAVGGGEPRGETVTGAPRPKLDTSHPLERLIRAQRSPGVFILTFSLAVICVPFWEELFFRVMFQGWLEGAEPVWVRRKLRRRYWPRELVPLIVPALIFAVLHARAGTAEAPNPDNLIRLFVVTLIVTLISLVGTIGLLTLRYGATSFDLGLDLNRIGYDCTIGIAAFLALAVPVHGLQIGIQALFPHAEQAFDPIPLFLFALGLGFLYQRTHRIWPSFVAHAALNASSMVFLWLA